MLPHLKCCSPLNGEEEIPSLYLLGEVTREQPNSSSVSMLLIRLFYPGLPWELQSELHWASKQKTNSHTQAIPPIPQVEIDYRPQRASSKQAGFFLDREPEVTLGNSLMPSQNAPGPPSGSGNGLGTKRKPLPSVPSCTACLTYGNHRLSALQLLLNNSNRTLHTVFHKGTQYKNRACINCALKRVMYSLALCLTQ